MKKLLFRLSFYLLVSTLGITALFSQQLFLENGTSSHPDVLSYSSQTRTIIDFAGTWDYSLDAGVSWQKVKIPAATWYEGKIVYRKKFSVDDNTISNNIFKLVSYGINYQAEVFINETFIGKHIGGYTSFELSIPENIIQIGVENVIRIVVDNTLDHKSTFPLRPQINGWRNYNGLLRDIFIVGIPKVHIDRANVIVEAIEPKATKLLISSFVGSKDLHLQTQLTTKTFQISVDVTEISTGIVMGKPVVTPILLDAEKEISSQISVPISNAKLWSPDSPELYKVKVQLQAVEGKKDSLLDEVTLITGIRTFTKSNRTLLFNGAPIVLNGVMWVEDTEQYGSAMTYEALERDVALIKNLGANVVRVGFHPPHPFFLQLCDRYGLLVMEEIPNFEIPQKMLDREEYRALAIDYLKQMIERDKYHPSVIAWGLGENFGSSSEEGGNIVTEFHRTAKSLDDRLTYVVTQNSTDDVIGVVDIAALSLTNVEIKTFRKRLISFKELHSKKPVMVAGYGKPIENNNRNGYSDPRSQEAQARVIQQRFSIIKEQNIAGSIIFSFNDYFSERPILNIKSDIPHSHTNGIVEISRQKKIGYDVVRSLFHNQKVSALPVGSFVPSFPYEYVVIGLILLIVSAWLVNGNRRFRESTRRAILNSYNFFADIRDQFTLPLFHTTITAVIISVTFSVISSSILHHFREHYLLDYILSYFLPDSLKTILITMSWKPLLSVGYFSALLFVWFFVLTLLIQIFASVARVKVRLFHSYSIAVWAALPWAFFIPVAMILYRVLESDPYVPWVMGLIVIISLWVYLRLLKGISVIYHVYTPKMYMLGFVIVFIVASGVYGYLDYTISLTAYLDFFASHVLPFAY